MKIKVIMGSGKEYMTERYGSIDEFLSSASGNSRRINYTFLDEAETIFINGDNISSLEIIKE
ncbi:hypothetical protein [Planococcus lenghuensis]|uniref:Uncharacterized protein n=1 Tax=Planococcus lenghuensis TaxID=2213202 RepID=A0A1Q2KZA2_9BACL|nr:hypothetical protein [Planococcus lenghuensis]AQQ53529.1 hypothetical protein B0X71_10900 [Planococcus lenghuensis]